MTQGSGHEANSDGRAATRLMSVCPCDVTASGESASGHIRDISAVGAFIETVLATAIGDDVEISHPISGTITATVKRISADGIGVSFPDTDEAVTFALRTLAASMTRPQVMPRRAAS